ncbi:hypothetical protein [Moorena sp. SIO3H5]|uniref:hypothetical protein n=1 Tax=Moorena sp. SIO3H5 TaxID=2607834 RepID=UPI0013B60DF7|nr:hypothetical protein [Moorena sp. SIO3H5]NEO73927.1 hypothetical protein [Moorena sp. SIO3H5]
MRYSQLSFPDSLFPVPCSLFPVPFYTVYRTYDIQLSLFPRLPTPNSRFPIPDSRFPIPDYLFPNDQQ